MLKEKKLTAKFQIKVEVPFVSYSSKKKNRRALIQIKQALKEVIEDHGYISLHIEQDGPGGDLMVDITDFVKVAISDVNGALDEGI